MLVFTKQIGLCKYVYNMYVYVCIYSATCIVGTRVGTHSWLVSTLNLVPSSCTLCQTVLTVSTSDEKYIFGVPFKVLFTK